ncbi:MAG TPA: transcription elongation factor GreA [Anaerolineaceae bacterium]|jgi:transcription elongation factor GreA|nr:transcription elongation factor GreA [Anaerolineaceae bacterium]
MKQPIIITPAGKTQLEKELAELKGPRRDAISKRLKSAIEMGDLSENADYKAAKEDQGFLEGRIQEIEAILSKAEITEDTPKNNGKVQIGNRVTIREEGQTEETWTVVGASEADLKHHKISYFSPIGSALMDRKVGDVAEVTLPNGSKIFYKILKIE